MKEIKRLSKQAIEFCKLSGYDPCKVKKHLKSEVLTLYRCTSISEMNEQGCDYSYPYVVKNDFNIDINS